MMLDPTKAKQMKAGAEIAKRLRMLRLGKNRRQANDQQKADNSALDILRTTCILSKLSENS